jgi:hypothetical protein
MLRVTLIRWLKRSSPNNLNLDPAAPNFGSGVPKTNRKILP